MSSTNTKKAEDRRLRSLAKKAEHFKFDEVDCDFDSSEGWIEYFPREDVPEEVELDGETTENLTTIHVDLEYSVELGYDSGTYISDDGHGDWYDRPGPYVEDIDFYDTLDGVQFMFEDREISREEFKELNELTDEEVDAMVGWCITDAEDAVYDYAENHIDNFM